LRSALVSAPKQSVVVTRDYRPASDNCINALALLLKKPVRKNPAAGPSERGKHDGTIKEDSADA
jgi:hypothetical protein